MIEYSKINCGSQPSGEVSTYLVILQCLPPQTLVSFADLEDTKHHKQNVHTMVTSSTTAGLQQKGV